MNRSAMLRTLFVSLSALALASCQQPAAEAPPLEGASIGGPFALQDAQGKTVRWSDFDGKYRIVYFGYTYCPDVCPTDMQRIAAGYNAFKAEHPALAAQVVPIFIAVDPKRDTPEKVGEFTRAFADDIVGLTGTEAEVDEAAKKFAVYVERGEPNEEGGYLVNHSSATYLMGRKGEPIAVLPTDQVDKGKAFAAELEKWVS